MFGEGEVAVFRKSGMQPVFFGEALVGPKLPRLSYMLAYPDMAGHDKAWAHIGARPRLAETADTARLLRCRDRIEHQQRLFETRGRVRNPVRALPAAAASAKPAIMRSTNRTAMPAEVRGIAAEVWYVFTHADSRLEGSHAVRCFCHACHSGGDTGSHAAHGME